MCMNCYTKDMSGHIGKFICVSVAIGVLSGMFYGASEEYERSKNKGGQKLVDMSLGVYLGGVLGLITGPTSIITGSVIIWKKLSEWWGLASSPKLSLLKALSADDQTAKIRVLESQVASLQQSLSQSLAQSQILPTFTNEVTMTPVYHGSYPANYTMVNQI